MLKSMTGFGRAEEVVDDLEIKISVKSVNHRYSDFYIKVPRYYNFLEEKIRACASRYISRGKAEIMVSIDQLNGDDRIVKLNRGVAESYIEALKELKEYDLTDDLSISTIAGFSDIYNIEYKEIDEELICKYVLGVLEKAMEEFVEMRTAEGGRLAEKLYEQLDGVLVLVDKIEKRSPECTKEYMDKLYKKLSEILESTAIDESRILTEAAVFADKTAVDEETVRLRSHVNEFRKAMDSNEPCGKKLDFIVQEMNREANTIGSKASDLEVAKIVVDLKSEIEKIREQIQNIE